MGLGIRKTWWLQGKDERLVSILGICHNVPGLVNSRNAIY